MRFKSDPEALVLTVLADGPQHGYGIVKLLRERSAGLFKMNEGQLYPLLHGMQTKGWIEGNWETGESGPARKSYLLLEAGMKELERRRDEWSQFSTTVNNLMSVEFDKRGRVNG